MAEHTGEHRAARVYDALRTAHLERFAQMTPAEVIYREKRYDFAPLEIAGVPPAVQMSRFATVRHLLRTRYTAVEVNEPLMTGRWLDVFLQIAAIRLGDRLHGHGRRTVIGAYCIGRNDPTEKLRSLRRVPRPLGRWWARVVVRALTRSMDRLAFGTTATWELVTEYAGPLAIDRGRLFPAVAQRCGCPNAQRDRNRVLFVGAFTERKGIAQLMSAWQAVSDAGLHLHIIGKGPLESDVRGWAAGRGDVTLDVDPPRAQVHEAYRRAHVLALLSQRVDYWREQVGLPIVEGLAHGCEIVTTDDTGLAGWLIEHGHTVIPTAASNDPAVAAAAITAAARRDRAAGEILGDLPEVDPRHEADAWLLRPDAGRPRPMASARTRARAYALSARRAARVYGVRPAGLFAPPSERPVFVVGSPRSGTSFTAACIGTVPGFTDLGEWRPLKLEVGTLAALPDEVAARRVRQLIAGAHRVTLAGSGRPLEQTPESTYLIRAIARAYPDATFVHLTRDGRDVAASLLRLGWVSTSGAGTADEVGQAFGAHSRFWVEPERREEFVRASDATRAAWVWRRYETTARDALAAVRASVVEVRYEDLVARPDEIAAQLATQLAAPHQLEQFRTAFADTSAAAAGRWRRDLSDAELADVLAEAGELLRTLSYVD
jgi:glycosyltransferase involved in cell wall biosynthesis